MMNFSIDISPLTWTLMAVAVVAAISLLIFYRATIARIRRRSEQCFNLEIPAQLPDVSVIVYCNNAAQSLERILDQIFNQHYDGSYDVIIVNDGSDEDVKDVFKRQSQTHPNLFLTFIPDDARNLSRRKLAITLGVKGARYPNVIVVDATSTIRSSHWLEMMARHFAFGMKVVLGYAVYDRHKDDENGRRLRSFDTAADAVTYLSAAIARHPYRGHGANIGFTRDLFLGAKGFARSLNLHAGEDDIFISQIATPDNTAVELAPRTRVLLGGERPRSLHRRWKWSHIFTGQRVTSRARLLMGFYSLLLWVATATAIAAAIVALPNLLPAAAMLLIGVITWIVLIIAWRHAIRALGGRRLWFTIPWFVMTRPAYNLYYRIVARRNRSRCFTWAAPK